MTPERWRLISQVYHGALARHADQRSAFLVEACGGDVNLRCEVESLLEEANRSAVIDQPGWTAATQHDVPTLPSGTSVGPYRIEAPIGEGGMGRVYRAHDTRLRRLVAIKFLSSPVHDDEWRRQQLESEAIAVAGLRHAHICVLHDIGQYEGTDFLVMEYLEGETLAQVLTAGAMPVDQVLRYALEIASALVETHRHRIVHRDLKPANIMVTSSGAKLLDFGLAVLQSTSAAAPRMCGARRTMSLPVAGTLAYMSPEQRRGTFVDHRSDVFAFGAVLYEMVTGKKAFDLRGSDHAELAATRGVPIDRSLVAAIAAVARKCLKNDAAARWQNASDVLQALHAVSGLETAAAPTTARSSHPSVVVLPFMDNSDDQSLAWFGNALTEEVTNALAQFAGLDVIARASARGLDCERDKVGAIRRMLNVTHLVRGVVSRIGDRVDLRTALIDAADGTEIWTDRFEDVATGDVLAVRDAVIWNVTKTLNVDIYPARPQLHGRAGRWSVEGYECYMRARQLNLEFTAEALTQALALVERARALEGHRASILALKGTIIWNLHNVGARPVQSLDDAVAHLEQATALEPDLADALVVRALLEYRAETVDAGLILRLLRRASARERRVEANMWLSVVLSETGRPELALSFAEIALELDPLTPIVSVAGAIPLVHLGRADEACSRLIRASAREPLKPVLFFAAVCAAAAGRFDDARQQFDRVYERGGGVWDSLAQLYLRSLDGDSEGTMAAASDPALVAYARRAGQACWYLAQTLAHAGHHAAALSWLERGAARTFVDARFVAQFDQMLAGLRPHAEFSPLLRFMEKRAVDIHLNGFD